MPRVFHVTLTKEFDCTILAESEKELDAALTKEGHRIDADWDPPDDWDWTAHDPLLTIKKSEKVPKELAGFDMAVIDGEVLSADERGDLKLKIDALKAKAEADLADLRMKLGVAEANEALPFVKPAPKAGRELLEPLQEEQRPWVKHNFGDRPSWMPLIGIVEELGEYSYAKEGDFESGVRWEKTIDALCDAMIFASDYCSAMSWSMADLWDAALTYTVVPVSLARSTGMMCHAYLKTAQGIRVNENHEVEGRLGMIYVLAHLRLMAEREGVDLVAETHRVWQTVKKRDWKKDPAHAGG